MSNILTQLSGAVSSFKSAMSLLTSSLSVDVVRITDSEGRQVFAMARAIKAGVMDDSELFQHALEDGNKTTDFKIDKPIVIQLGVMIPTDTYQPVYSSLVDAKKRGEQFIVQTRAGSFPNMIIKSMPHEESPEYGDCLVMQLTFEEVKWYATTVEMLPAREVAGNKKSAGAKQDADTVKSGQKRASDASDSTKKRSDSILYGWTH
jgi:hypothetical protein